MAEAEPVNFGIFPLPGQSGFVSGYVRDSGYYPFVLFLVYGLVRFGWGDG